MNGRPQTNTNRVTGVRQPLRPWLREFDDKEEDDRKKAVGSMLQTVASSITLGVQSANRNLRKDISWIIKIIGAMAFLIGVLLTMVIYAYIL